MHDVLFFYFFMDFYLFIFILYKSLLDLSLTWKQIKYTWYFFTEWFGAYANNYAFLINERNFMLTGFDRLGDIKYF